MSRDIDDALEKARGHLQQAALEGIEAARVLLEVAVKSSGLADASPDSLVSQLQRSLDELVSKIRENSSFALPRALAEPLAVALEAEIKRWERRSRTDPDARPVLRAFLGLRELLWEIGLGRNPRTDETSSGMNPDQAGPTRSPRERVQRFDVEN